MEDMTKWHGFVSLTLNGGTGPGEGARTSVVRAASLLHVRERRHRPHKNQELPLTRNRL